MKSWNLASPVAFGIGLFLVCAHVGAADTSLYVQDGLVAHWDGIENAGAGVAHDPAATTWKDLVCGREFSLTGVTVNADRMTFAGNVSSFGNLSADDTAATFGLATNGTVEIVYASSSASTAHQILLQSSAASGIAFSIYDKTTLIVCNVSAPTVTFTSGIATNCVSIRYAAAKSQSAFINGASAKMGGNNSWSGANTETFLGRRATTANSNPFPGSIYAVRVYSRRLTNEEIATNHLVDALRFKGDTTAITPVETALNETGRREGDCLDTSRGFSPPFTSRLNTGADGDFAFSVPPIIPSPSSDLPRWGRVTGGTLYEVENGTATAVATTTSTNLVHAKSGKLLRMVWDVAYEDVPTDTALYATDGLLACWDGIANVGSGLHDSAATAWKDLVAGRAFTLSGVTVEDDRLVFAGAATSFGTLTADDSAATFGRATNGTVEIVYASATGSTAILLQSSTASGISFGLNGASQLVLCNANAPSITFTSGTATNAVAVRYALGKSQSGFVNDKAATMGANSYWSGSATTTTIGLRANKTTPYAGSLYALRVYGRQLTDVELAVHRAVDAARFRRGTAVTPFETALSATGQTVEDRLAFAAHFSPAFTRGAFEGLSGDVTFSAAAEFLPLENSVFRRAHVTGGTLYEVENGVETAVATTSSTSLTYARTGKPLRMVWNIVYENAPDSVASILHVTPEGAGAKNGADWANAFDSLQDAVNAASNAAARCLIKMKAGTYSLTNQVEVRSLPQPLTIRGGYAGSGDSLSDEDTVLKRLTTPTKGRALLIANCPGVLLERLAVTGCSVTPVKSGTTSGLAIYSSNTELAFRDCAVTNNSIYVTTGQTYNGGGLYITGGSLSVEDSLFAGNSVGGAADYISCYGGAIRATSLTRLALRNSTFSNNMVRAHYIPNQGGALHLSSIADATISNCVFAGNWALKSPNYGGRDNGYGGCICASSVTSFRIADSLFTGNGNNARPGSTWTYGGRGGTLYLSGGSTVIERTVFLRNGYRPTSATTLDSGSLYLASGSLALRNVLHAGSPYGHALELAGGTLTAERCTIADMGSGYAFYQTGSAAATFTDCIFANNAQGVYLISAGTEPVFTRCCAETLLAGVANIAAEPLLAAAPHYHPKSAAGHYAGGWFSGGAWTVGDETSPTIDAGDPAAGCGDEPQPNRHIANIGYDAGTAVASKSVLGSEPLVDPAQLKVFAYPVADIGSDSATAIAEVASTGGGANPSLTIVWDAADRGTADVSAWANQASLGTAALWTPVTHVLTGLSGNVVYRFVVANERGTAWSDAVSFALAIPPVATLDSVIRVTRHGATVRATLVSDGGTPTTAKLIVARADGTGDAIEIVYDEGNPVAPGTPLEIPVEGLEADTSYVFTLAAENSAGTSAPSVTLSTLTTDPVVRYVTPAGAGLRDGSSWENAYQLQDAFNECLYAGDEAHLLAGTYIDYGYNDANDRSQSFLDGAAGLTIRGGYTGEGDARGPAATILDRDTAALPSPQRRLVRVAGSSVVFDSLVFTNGTLASGSGLGVNLASSEAVFLNCRFERNRNSLAGSFNGGAIYASGGVLAVTNCVFAGNVLSSDVDDRNNYGGAIYATGARVSIADSEFLSNRVYVRYKTNVGGALYFSGATRAEVVRCLFSTNTAAQLNGYVNNFVAGGAAIGAEAGANVAGSLHVADCQFVGNATHSSERPTRGIVFVSGALLKAEFERCSFIGSGHSSNSDIAFASRHGDIALAAGTLGLADCLLAQADGSNAVHVVGGTLRLRNVTIADNLGRALWASSSSATVTMTNSIVWGNALGGIVGAYAENVAAGYSLVQGETVWPGTRNILADPNFRADPPWRLKALSPCVGTGLLLDGMRESRDLAGNPRVIGSAVDLGCYEMDTPHATVILLR